MVGVGENLGFGPNSEECIQLHKPKRIRILETPLHSVFPTDESRLLALSSHLVQGA